MSSLPIAFPHAPRVLEVYPNKIFGLKYTVVKAPEFSTIVQSSPSGASTRIGQRRNPLWHFTLCYEQLFNDETNPQYAEGELAALMGFYLLQQGQLGEFLFDDPEDDVVNDQVLSLVSDAADSPVTAASVGSSAGTGFAVNDQLLVAGGGGSGAVLQVASIGAGGAITGFTVAAGGSGYVTTTDAALTVLTGSGTGSPTADITSMPLWFSPLQRQMGSYFEDITDLNPNVALAVEVNAAAAPSGSYSISASPGLSISGNSYVGLYLQWAQWAPNTAYALGALLIDPAGHLQKITTAGASGAMGPTFNDSGSTTVDGTATWTDQGVPSITASFGFYFRVRFETDRQDFERFLQKLYTIGGTEGRLGSGSVKLVSARPVPGEISVNMTLPSALTDGSTRPGQAMVILRPILPQADIVQYDSGTELTGDNVPGGQGFAFFDGPSGIQLHRGPYSRSIDTSGAPSGEVNQFRLPNGIQPSQVTEIWAVIAAVKTHQKIYGQGPPVGADTPFTWFDSEALTQYHANFGLASDDTINSSSFGDLPVSGGPADGSNPYNTFSDYSSMVDARKVAPVPGANGYPTSLSASRWNDATAAAAKFLSCSFSASLQSTVYELIDADWAGEMILVVWYTPS